LGIKLVIDEVRFGAVTELGIWQELKKWGQPVFKYHYDIGAGSVLGKDQPDNEYLKIYDAKGNLVETRLISTKGGNLKDIIHHQYGRVPEAGSYIWTEVVYNTELYGSRVEPGRFIGLQSGLITPTDSPLEWFLPFPFKGATASSSLATFSFSKTISFGSRNKAIFFGRSLGAELSGSLPANVPLHGAKAITEALRKSWGKRIEFIQGTGANATKIKVKIPEGFTKVKGQSHGQPVFSDGKRFISPDADGHVGGIWKMADSIENLRKKETRIGTFDASLSKIAD